MRYLCHGIWREGACVVVMVGGYLYRVTIDEEKNIDIINLQIISAQSNPIQSNPIPPQSPITPSSASSFHTLTSKKTDSAHRSGKKSTTTPPLQTTKKGKTNQIQRPPNQMILNPGTILTPPTTNKYHSMLLYIMPLTRNISRNNLFATQTYTGYFTFGGIWLFGGHDEYF